MSGLSSPVFLGLIGGQVVLVSVTEFSVAKVMKERTAFSGIGAAAIAYVVWLVIGLASLDTLANPALAGLDREALVLAWPITGVIGCLFYWACGGLVRFVKSQKNA